nr:hypothetical protein [Angustibacter aerolatus]
MPLKMLRQMRLVELGFGLDTEITANVLRFGARPFEVPVSYHARSHDEGKKINWRDAVRCLQVLGRVRVAPDPRPAAPAVARKPGRQHPAGAARAAEPHRRRCRAVDADPALGDPGAGPGGRRPGRARRPRRAPRGPAAREPPGRGRRMSRLLSRGRLAVIAVAALAVAVPSAAQATPVHSRLVSAGLLPEPAPFSTLQIVQYDALYKTVEPGRRRRPRPAGRQPLEPRQRLRVDGDRGPGGRADHRRHRAADRGRRGDRAHHRAVHHPRLPGAQPDLGAARRRPRALARGALLGAAARLSHVEDLRRAVL